MEYTSEVYTSFGPCNLKEKLTCPDLNFLCHQPRIHKKCTFDVCLINLIIMLKVFVLDIARFLEIKDKIQMTLRLARYLTVGQDIELYPPRRGGYLAGRYNSIFISSYIK